VFKTEYNQSIALDRKKAEAAQTEILTTYRIGEDRSVDLKAAAGNNATDGKKLAVSGTVEATVLQ
jgi:urease beta subunit